MIADIIAFAAAHPFIAGMIVGGCAFGGPLSIIGWCIGYDHAMRKVGDWMRPIPKPEPIHGVLFRPTIVPDGDKWHALYGPNQMEGVSGFGDTPAEAMADFDQNWLKQKTHAAILADQSAEKIAAEEAREAALANGQFGVGA